MLVATAWHVLKEDPVVDAFDDCTIDVFAIVVLHAFCIIHVCVCVCVWIAEGEFPGALLFSLRCGRTGDVPTEVHPICRPLLNPNYRSPDADDADSKTKGSIDVLDSFNTPAAAQAPAEVCDR